MLPPGQKDRWLVGAVVTLLIGVVFYVGSRYVRPRASVEIQGLPSGPAQPQDSTNQLPTTNKRIKVDIEGAVKTPGLKDFDSDARVADAIEAAGGKTDDADVEPLNLAAKLNDGTQLYVPHKAKQEDTKVAENYQGGPKAPSSYSSHPTSHSRGGGGGDGKKHPNGPVSLNTATADQLENLPGIGPSTAQKILDYRQEHVGFSSIDEILAVKGIGPKKLKAMRPFLRL